MSSKTETTAEITTAENKFNRRYVGTKETIGYIVFDMAQSFNLDGAANTFITNIFKLDLEAKATANAINGIWDVINDTFTGAIVDRTRTRWGKFKPYLVVLGIPATIAACIFWFMPLILPNAAPASAEKFLLYLGLAILRETGGTFRGFARTGMLSTITPNPSERSTLITMAQFLSGFLGEKLPGQLLEFFIDMVDYGWIFKNNREIGMRNVYIGLGVTAAIISGIAALWFATIAKERLMQTVEKPSIRQGIKSIINNKPILLITLSEMLSNFSLFSGNKTYYFQDVLHFKSLGTFVGIPGAIVHPFSYALVPWFRKRFSTKTCAIIGKFSVDLTYIPVFLFGCIGGKKNGMYKKIVPMGIALALQETTYMFLYGLKKVIPEEMYNEAMDYCEWKNGYRSEATTAAAKEIARKLAANLSSSVQDVFLKRIGYDINSYTQGTAQTDNTKFWLFAMFTIMPSITTVLGVIPLLFYDLSGEKRDKMYEELMARRAMAVDNLALVDTQTE